MKRLHEEFESFDRVEQMFHELNVRQVMYDHTSNDFGISSIVYDLCIYFNRMGINHCWYDPIHKYCIRRSSKFTQQQRVGLGKHCALVLSSKLVSIQNIEKAVKHFCFVKTLLKNSKIHFLCEEILKLVGLDCATFRIVKDDNHDSN